jgi:hypothetical protein
LSGPGGLSRRLWRALCRHRAWTDFQQAGNGVLQTVRAQLHPARAKLNDERGRHGGEQVEQRKADEQIEQVFHGGLPD